MRTIREIQGKVAAHYGLTVLDMVGKRRNLAEARPRQLAMWLSRHCTGHSLPEIGRMFGGRDHTTVAHAIWRIDQLMKDDPELARIAKRFRDQFMPSFAAIKPTLRIVA